MPDRTTPEPPAGAQDDHLQRGLSNRHIQLIAIGGAIGTGLFLGSGRTISLAGPSVLLVYAVIGFMLFFVMRAMGEMLLSNLEYKSFRDMAADILGPWAGFVTGWTYWFCWIVTGIADVVAVSGYVAFWAPDLPRWLPALGLVVLLLALNLVAVRLFGELEFWFAIVKIVAIVALIVTGVVMIATAFQGADGATASLTHLYADGGFFPHGLTGFLAGFQIAIFAFVGIELVGTTAAETRDPETTLPRAINAIPVRVLLFYLGALVVIMAVTPWRSIDPAESPFVAMFALAGLPAAAGVINLVVLTSAASSANSGIFSTSRMLYGLAEDREAPAPFARLSSRHVPSRGLVFSCACLLPGVALLYAGRSVIEAFTLVTTVATLLFLVVWTVILLSYLAYRRRSPELHAASRFPMPGGRVMAVVVLAFFASMVVVLALEPETRVALLVLPVWFAVLGAAWAVLRRRGVVPGRAAPDVSGGPDRAHALDTARR
ncbi:D-serine/D-alanine/glycine transporter [Cellulomonas triticagri]|uniref:D-serine/D-alanine/glycine transporter n=1 Tax=Cellulomonas triticagri TaxID=2483352 RepID=A0A3M2JKQ2_9CELL|nr:D-serine/D-alanine/glycine transporter [Cellulomonas triticagri]RMI12440.1 D-serine/D-alanine/glycine transporter [Cellulomonas triticagri]